MRAILFDCAQIGTVTSRVDNAVSFRVVTQELNLEQRATLLGLHGTNVKIMLEPRDAPVEGLDEVKTEAEPKSKCQRLRAALFRMWEQHVKGAGTANPAYTFPVWYDIKMEALIDKIKDKLDPT